MEHEADRATVTDALTRAGCVAAEEEADELMAASAAGRDLAGMVARRLTGEPLAWIIGHTTFCGLEVTVDPGVYVPRWQSEALARLAADLLPPAGIGVDLATGSGAVAMVMQAARPGARVVATEIDPVAVRCARRNGVVVYPGHLDRPLPPSLAARVDVLGAVLPYVPSDALHLLPRDVVAFEPRVALDGGTAGLDLVAAVVRSSRDWLRPGGWVVFEVGTDQVPVVTALLAGSGYTTVEVLMDADGDPRGVYGQTVASPAAGPRTLGGGQVPGTNE